MIFYKISYFDIPPKYHLCSLITLQPETYVVGTLSGRRQELSSTFQNNRGKQKKNHEKREFLCKISF